MTAGSDEYNTLNAESVDLQNSFFIKSYYNFLSDLNPPKKSRVVSIYHAHVYFILFDIYLFGHEVCLFVECHLSVLQNQRPIQLLLLFLSPRKELRRYYAFPFSLLMSDLRIPMPFLDTFNARHNKLSIDFTWSGSIFQMKPSKLPAGWKRYSENHQRFVAYRNVFVFSHLKQQQKTFSLGVKCLDRNLRVPKDILKEIKHQWCNCHDDLEDALN